MAAKYKICPHCSHKIKTTTTFCIHCGKDLRNVKFVEYNNALVAESSVAKTETKATEEVNAEPTPTTPNIVPSEVPVQNEVPNTATPFTGVTESPAVAEPITEPIRPVAEPVNSIVEPVYTNTVDIKEEKKEEVKQPEPQINEQPAPQVHTPVQTSTSERPNPFKAMRNSTVAPVNVVPPAETTTPPRTETVSIPEITPTPTAPAVEPVRQEVDASFAEPVVPKPVMPVAEPVTPQTGATPTVTPMVNETQAAQPQPEVIVETPMVAPTVPTHTETIYEKHSVPTEKTVQAKVSHNPLPQSFVLEVSQPVAVAKTEKEPVQPQVEPSISENDGVNAPNLAENTVFETQANISSPYKENEQYEASITATQAKNNTPEVDEFMSDTDNNQTKIDNFMEDNTVSPVPEIEHAKSGVVLGRIPDEEEKEDEENQDIFFKNEDTIREEPYDARKDGYYEDVEAEVEEEIKHTMADSTKKTILAIVLSLVAITIYAFWKGYI